MFGQFPTLNFGLAHFTSQPFNYRAIKASGHRCSIHVYGLYPLLIHVYYMCVNVCVTIRTYYIKTPYIRMPVFCHSKHPVFVYFELSPYWPLSTVPRVSGLRVCSGGNSVTSSLKWTMKLYCDTHDSIRNMMCHFTYSRKNILQHISVECVWVQRSQGTIVRIL
jgi:hypothetical protein